MAKRIISLFLLAALALCLFAACSEESSVVTEDKAIQIALKDAGCEAKNVTGLHVHTGTEGKIPVYEIHFSHGEDDYTYVINGLNGEILSKADQIQH